VVTAFLFLGGVTGVVALVVALAWATTPAHFIHVYAVGLVLAVAYLCVVYFTAQPGDEHARCSDCGVILGRWIDPAVVFVVGVSNIIAWFVGATVGGLVRLRRSVAA
jgi:hypothetical protein